MQAYCCVLCKENDRDFFNISHENGRNSVRDNIVELCGISVAQYLQDDDIVCLRCMSVLDGAAKLKRQLYEVLVESGTKRQLLRKPDTRVVDYAEFSQEFDYDDTTEDSPPNVPSTSSPNYLENSLSPHNLPGLSPDNLLMIQKSIPFDQRSDTDMDEANSKYRYYERDTPLLDREVQRANFRGRRKTKGHNWTRRKGSQRARSYSNSRSSSSKYGRNTYSRSSRGTTTSKRNEILLKSQKEQRKRIFSDFLCENDTLAHFTRRYLILNEEDFNLDEWNTDKDQPIVRTRYASGLREKVLNDFVQTIYECPVDSCDKIMKNVEELTEHRVEEHNEMALFWCDQCKFSYLTQEHLDKHKENHFQTFVSYCIYCSQEFQNKRLYEEHLNEHLIHSFPCIYCDKFFLRKQICENHIRAEHPGRKKKIKRIKPQSILDRIDKYPDQDEELRKRAAADSSKGFVVKVLWQHGKAKKSKKSLLDSSSEEDDDVDFIDFCGARNADFDEPSLSD